MIVTKQNIGPDSNFFIEGAGSFTQIRIYVRLPQGDQLLAQFCGLQAKILAGHLIDKMGWTVVTDEQCTMIEEFEDMLSRHDWFFEYSDDHRVWTAGQRQRADILKTKDKLHRENLAREAEDLWNKYCPGPAAIS